MSKAAKRPRSTQTSRKARGSQRKSSNSIGLWLIGGAVVIVALVVALVVAGQSTPQVDTAQYAELPNDWVNGRVVGDPAAPVTIQAWEDFLCPACQQWTSQIKSQVMDDFVSEGQVKIEFNYLPLAQHDPGATLGALAAECAAEQGAFWPYHDMIFAVAASQGMSGFTLERLVGYAEELDLDSSQFTQCVSSQRHIDVVQESRMRAVELGINSTPSILVNGQLMENPFDYNELTAAVENALGTANAE
jgi:protein-disulfide isomerase